ncbi:MAG: hypothetical protein OEY86_18370 [Nitrospira sp.]|nr:hypothetical protein [Nitrospira sp.]
MSTGQRSRTIPALATVYQQEGLPAPRPGPAAETRVLALDPAMQQFVTSLQTAHRHPRRAQRDAESATPPEDGHSAPPG